MSERYTITAKAEEIKKRFDVAVPSSYSSRYNAAPTQILPIITNESPEGLSFFYWGLIPSWSKNNSISQKLINARGETLGEKASFKTALKHRRCLVIADGFYEWKAIGKKTKVPYRIKLVNDELFSFAGLWEEFEDDQGEMMHTFTIVTTEANQTISQIHDRMPVIFKKDQEKLWLDDSLTAEEHLELLKPVSSDLVKMYSVSPQVNNVRNDYADLIRHTPPADQFGNYTLFN